MSALRGVRPCPECGAPMAFYRNERYETIRHGEGYAAREAVYARPPGDPDKLTSDKLDAFSPWFKRVHWEMYIQSRTPGP